MRHKKHWTGRIDRIGSIVRSISSSADRYIIFGSLDNEPGREIQIIVPPEQMEMLFRKYLTLKDGQS